ncbi:MAG: F0F1 ATP synthase subunit epsilon [Actinomycetota bacterium]|nr:MAG: F0F1 ATP synthase subunit epsilon [Actinomycetota bacterium]
MAELQVEVVAVDGSVWDGAARMVVAKTIEGDIGILPGHEPVLALLADGVLRIQTPDGATIAVAVHEGFFSVDSDVVSVLAESAELGSQIDVASAEAALAAARAATDDDGGAAVRRAESQLRAAGALGH